MCIWLCVCQCMSYWLDAFWCSKSNAECRISQPIADSLTEYFNFEKCVRNHFKGCTLIKSQPKPISMVCYLVLFCFVLFCFVCRTTGYTNNVLFILIYFLFFFSSSYSSFLRFPFSSCVSIRFLNLTWRQLS